MRETFVRKLKECGRVEQVAITKKPRLYRFSFQLPKTIYFFPVFSALKGLGVIMQPMAAHAGFRDEKSNLFAQSLATLDF